MNRHLLLALTLFVTHLLSAQVVTTTPAFITKDYRGEVTITFDPNQGNRGMVGATACYAHTGACTATQDWLCAPTWRDGSSRTRLTQVGDKWQLTIPNMYEYYSCLSSGAVITRLAFVFNDGPGGSREGKTVDGGDIFVDLYDSGLNVRFTLPTADLLAKPMELLYFDATSSGTAQLEFIINNTVVKSSSGTSINHQYRFDEVGDYVCVVRATAGSQMVTDTVHVCILGDNNPTPRPEGTAEGINYYPNDPTKATLVMYAKDKNGVLPDDVLVIGDFNGWRYQNSHKMNLDASHSGMYWLTLTGLEPGREYAFQYAVKMGNEIVKISDAYSEMVLDPWNDSYISEEIYPNLKGYPSAGDGLVSVLNTQKPVFQWSEATLNFQKPSNENLVVYELWVYDFCGERSISAATQRLDYLEQLGVNAIELMPITEFDGNISWGYNPNHFFAADKAYGTPEAYKTFIDECHKRGIAVILDMVFNHATASHPWAKLYWDGTANKTGSNNPWFNVDAPHPYSVFHDYNHAFRPTQEYFSRVLQYWIQEYKIDGYRMDLTKGLTNRVSTESTASNYDAERIANLKTYYDACRAVDPTCIFIIEHFCTASEERELSNYGMLPWNNVNNAFSQTAMGWLRDGDNLGGANMKGWISYGESHDEERNFFKALTYGNGNLKTNKEARLKRVPLNTAFSILQPGAKMVWMFNELGYDHSIDENGRTGTKPVPETLGWYTDAMRMEAYRQTGQMVQLRTKLLPNLFKKGSYTATVGSGVAGRYMRWSQNDTLLVAVGNFNVEGGVSHTGAVSVAPFHGVGTWYNYYTGEAHQVGSTSETLTLQPGEFRIYTTIPLALPNVPNSFDFTTSLPTVSENKQSFCTVYPTVVTDVLHIESKSSIKEVRLLTMSGQTIKQWSGSGPIPLSHLTSGLYLVVVSGEKQQQAFKIIKK